MDQDLQQCRTSADPAAGTRDRNSRLTSAMSLPHTGTLRPTKDQPTLRGSQNQPCGCRKRHPCAVTCGCRQARPQRVDRRLDPAGPARPGRRDPCRGRRSTRDRCQSHRPAWWQPGRLGRAVCRQPLQRGQGRSRHLRTGSHGRGVGGVSDSSRRNSRRIPPGRDRTGARPVPAGPAVARRCVR